LLFINSRFPILNKGVKIILNLDSLNLFSSGLRSGEKAKAFIQELSDYLENMRVKKLNNRSDEIPIIEQIISNNKLTTGNRNSIIWKENNIILNRLEVDASIELEETSAEVKLGERKKIDARSDSKITWTSSNPSIVSVDNDGNIFAKKFGSAVITISTRSSKVNYIVTVKKSTIQEEMKDFFNTITDSFKATFPQTSFDKMDINRDGKIDVIDVVNYVRLIFIRI